MKLVTWNIEWMNRWFLGNSNPQWGNKRRNTDGRIIGDYTEAEARIQAQKAANVILDLNADLICVQEGPSSKEEMDLFITDFLSGCDGKPLYECLIGHDGSSQKLYALRRIGGEVDSMEYSLDERSMVLADEWDADVNGDMLLEAYDFTRMPLVFDATMSGGRVLRVVVLHTKSKYVHRGRQRWQDPVRKQSFIVDALQARRRISAEGFRLRTYLDALLQDDLDSAFVVLGDFNDGPGSDFFERSYLTHNVTDIVLGSTFYPSLILHHPVIDKVAPQALFTARFDDFVDEVPDRPLFLDHILVSPALKKCVPDAGIAHDEYEAEIEGTGESRLERSSDHRPVWIALEDF